MGMGDIGDGKRTASQVVACHCFCRPKREAPPGEWVWFTMTKELRILQRPQRTAEYHHGGGARRGVRRAARAWHLLATVVLLCLGRGQVIQAAPLLQEDEPTQGVTRQLYLLPAESTTVRLQTHVASLSVVHGGDGEVSVYVDAAYTLSNPGQEAVTVPLLVFVGAGSAQPQDVSLMAANQALGLTPGEGGYAAQVEMGADARLTLQLRYRVAMDQTPLGTVRYAPSILRRWPGGISLRVEMSLPASIPQEAWTALAPDTWSYAPSTGDVTAVKWLYDAGMPQEPFVVQFVKPAVFAQIQAAAPGGLPASAANGAAGSYLALGDLYRSLSEVEAAPAAVRERFASQAIAAYVDGAARQSSATGDELARLYIGLAGIYRGRAVAAGAGAEEYAAAMAEAAAQALAVLPPDDGRRAELLRWRADGLRLVLDQAEAARDWASAAALLEELDALPDDVVDPETLARQRRSLAVEQALGLLARGERSAAIALAGPDIVGEVAMPPIELQPLFSRWEITATAGAEAVEILAAGQPAPRSGGSRVEEARQALADVENAWQPAKGDPALAGVTVETVSPVGEDGLLQLRVVIPAGADSARLATYLPTGADWALLAAVLGQAGTTVEKTSRLFWQDVRVSQPLDLRSAGERWNGLAANLERQAAELAGQAGVDAEAALRNQIQAVNYRTVAGEWRKLARDSWLLYRFTDERELSGRGGESDGAVRAWYATVKSPPLVFSVQSQAVNRNVVTGAAVLMAVFVVGMSGLLWRLM